MTSTGCPCEECAHTLRCKDYSLACKAFASWVDSGLTPDSEARDPNRAIFDILALPDSPQERHKAACKRRAAERRTALLAELQHRARRETFEHKRRVAAGLAQPPSKRERRRIQLARRWLRWRIDPSLREKYLRLKREDAIRRARRKGAAPKGSEGNRLHRIESQRHRREAERKRDGRTLNGAQFRELRQRLGLSVGEIAEQAGVTYSAAKQWQKSYGPPGRVEIWLRTLNREREKVPSPSGTFSVPSLPPAAAKLRALTVHTDAGVEADAVRGGRAAPVGAVMIGGGTHA